MDHKLMSDAYMW